MMKSSYTTPDNVQEPLLSSSGRHNASSWSPTSSPKTKANHAQLGRGILVNRYALLVFLAAVTVAGWYLQHEFIDLQTALQSEHDKVQTLEQQISIHEQVIQRFNSSITNTDVMNRLGNLETQFLTTEKHLRDELSKTQKEISDQLASTVQELSTTVTQAEAEISDEVEKVKKDVEQYVLTTQDQFSMENSFMVYQLAGTFTLLSCLISMWHMTAHMRKMNEPDVQRRILAILWMSPLYAVTSWFSLVFHQAEGYLAIIKDGYEAYIIYQFLSFCIAVLGKGDRNKVVDLLARHADHLTPPFRLFGCCEYMCGCCKPEPYENNRALADAILLQCQFFAMQFVLFRPLTTTAMVVLGKLEYYGAGDGPTDYRAPQFYITIIQNLSIFIAFTGLLKFYHAVDKELAWCRPFAKFLCIKGVVFMTFWQGLAISILAQTTDVGGQDEEEWAQSAQNFLICLEMLLFSIAHFYCFPTEEWQEGYRVKHEQGRFGDSIALGDFFNEVKLVLQSNPKKKKKRKGPSPHKSARKLEAVPEGNDDETQAERVEVLLDDAENGESKKGRNHDSCENDEKVSTVRSSSFGTGSSAETDDGGRYSTPSGQYDSEFSFTDSQNSYDDSDEETDEEVGMLSSRFEGLSEEDIKITKALEKSLGLAAHDPDIADAARRLLNSKVLSSDFFQSEQADDENIYRLYGADTSNDGTDDDGDAADYDDGDAIDDQEEGNNSMDAGIAQEPESALSHQRNKEHGEKLAGGSNGLGDGDECETRLSPTKILVDSPQKGTPLPMSEMNNDVGTANIDNNALQTGFEQSRMSSDGGFWAFEDNAPTPVRDSEPAPLPTPNERTPLLSRKSPASESPPGSPTPLKPSIFTTVAELAEKSEEQGRPQG